MGNPNYVYVTTKKSGKVSKDFYTAKNNSKIVTRFENGGGYSTTSKVLPVTAMPKIMEKFRVVKTTSTKRGNDKKILQSKFGKRKAQVVFYNTTKSYKGGLRPGKRILLNVYSGIGGRK